MNEGLLHLIFLRGGVNSVLMCLPLAQLRMQRAVSYECHAPRLTVIR